MNAGAHTTFEIWNDFQIHLKELTGYFVWAAPVLKCLANLNIICPVNLDVTRCHIHVTWSFSRVETSLRVFYGNKKTADLSVLI